VYNGAKYLEQSLQSILGQTLKDWELVVIDDGSTDATPEILDHWSKDKRVKIITNESNLGLTKSLNLGLRECFGKYVARWDGDDVCDPERLQKQYEFMEANPELALCGSQGWYLDEKGERIKEKNLPVDYDAIQAKLLFNNQFIHSSLFIRRSVIEQEGFYNESFKTSQDYELVLRLAKKYPVMNLTERLVDWRVGKNSLSWSSKRQEWDAIRARWWAITKYGYAKLSGLYHIILRLIWLLIPQALKRRRYAN